MSRPPRLPRLKLVETVGVAGQQDQRHPQLAAQEYGHQAGHDLAARRSLEPGLAGSGMVAGRVHIGTQGLEPSSLGKMAPDTRHTTRADAAPEDARAFPHCMLRMPPPIPSAPWQYSPGDPPLDVPRRRGLRSGHALAATAPWCATSRWPATAGPSGPSAPSRRHPQRWPGGPA